jgi:hypothetical protein
MGSNSYVEINKKAASVECSYISIASNSCVKINEYGVSEVFRKNEKGRCYHRR